MTRVLLVDDEGLILYSLSKMFGQAGAAVTAVTSGREALKKLQRDSYDICFLDVQLPDANGLELMSIVRRHSPATRIVIMTANELSGEQIRSIEDHGCLYLPKPFGLDAARALVTGHQRGPASGGP